MAFLDKLIGRVVQGVAEEVAPLISSPLKSIQDLADSMGWIKFTNRVPTLQEISIYPIVYYSKGFGFIVLEPGETLDNKNLNSESIYWLPLPAIE